MEQAFSRVLQGWHDYKLGTRYADERDFQWHSRSEVRPFGRLVEFALDQRGDYEGRWRTTCRLFETDGQAPCIVAEMSWEEIEERFAPAPFQVQPPRFLQDLGAAIRLQSNDGMDLPTSVLEVTDSEAAELLAEEILSPDRTIPLIVVTEPVYTSPKIPDLGQKLAKHIFGLGRVVRVGRSMTWVLSQRLGKELSVFDGGVRTYWPGLTVTTAPRDMPLITRKKIAEFGNEAERAILRTIGQKLILVATARYREPREIREFQLALDREEREAVATSQAALRAELNTTLSKLSEAKELEQIALSENQRLETENEDLEAEVKALRAEARNWKDRHDAVLHQLKERGGKPAPQPPSDEHEAVQSAKEQFSATLVFPDDLEMETDLGPFVYEALAAMNDAVLLERKGTMGDRRKAFAEIFGKRMNHPAKYEPGLTGLRYHGEEIRERVHIKSGKPEDTESIYWQPQGASADRKYVIVRIGRHL
ncbi:MAG TPA: hypothetical protein VI356_25320 [Myxococcales bacterium]